MSKLDLILMMITGNYMFTGGVFYFLWNYIQGLAKTVTNHHEHRLAALEAFVGLKEPEPEEEG